MKTIPSILNIKSCASLDKEVLQDLEAITPDKTIAELLDEEKNTEEKNSPSKE